MTSDVYEHAHTPYYCEENVYHLISWLAKQVPTSGSEQNEETESDQDKAIYAIFVTNAARRCLLFHQKAATSDREYVVWDYHVLAAVFPKSGGDGMIWDLDSKLGQEVPFTEYVEDTFRPDLYRPGGIAETLLKLQEPLFRVVPASDFLAHFASDRSHMLVPSNDNALESPTYAAVPPAWPAIVSPEAEKRGMLHNLWTRYLDVADREGTETWYESEREGKVYGRLMDLKTLLEYNNWQGVPCPT